MNKKQFLLFISVPLLVILAFVGIKLYTVTLGEEILLETNPIDPRDFFRGDYVSLNYKISRIDLGEITHDKNFTRDETVYAVLSKKEKFWTIDSVRHVKPDIGAGELCMKGKVTRVYEDTVSVGWGIESYFVPEGKGGLIERQGSGNVSVIVSVDQNCASVLKQIRINDEPAQFE